MSPVNRRRLVAVALVTLVVDALSKVVAVATLSGRTVDLGWLELRLVENTGVAFSLGDHLPAAVVVALTGVMMLVFTVAAWRGHLGSALPAGLILGGGFGNLVDRAIRGAVIDMFDVGPWPVFNIADVALTAGIILLVIATFGADDEPSTTDEADEATLEPSTIG